MYGKKGKDRIEEEIAALAKHYPIYLGEEFNDEVVESLYRYFIINMKEFNKVFIPRWVTMDEIISGTEGDIWRWESKEEKQMMANEIFNHGVYFPIIALPIGECHPLDLKAKERISSCQYYALDGSHRVDAMKHLIEEGKWNKDKRVLIYIVPSFCTLVRQKLKKEKDVYLSAQYLMEKKRPVFIMNYNAEVLYIDGLSNSEGISCIEIDNYLQFYNAATAIVHNLTALFYKYYQENNRPFNGIANLMHCFNDCEVWDIVINKDSKE